MSRNSSIDESLFGNTGRKKRGSALRGGGRSSLGPVPPEETIFLSRRELLRMQSSTTIKTPQMMRDDRRAAKDKLEIKMRQSKAKRERMEKLERIRNANLPPSEADVVKQKKDKKTIANAVHLRNEAEDDCKAMNAMMQYAQTVTIRDAQRLEKEYWDQRKRLVDRTADLKMEITRLEMLKMYQDRDRERKRKMVADRIHITRQIIENEKAAKERVREKMRDQVKIKARAAELEAEESAVLAQKKIEAKIMLEEVIKDNEQQIKYRKAKRQKEIEEDLLITKYLAEKAEKERLVEMEKERLAQERTLKVAAMRAQQKKNMDKNAALDALRAKRAAESNARKARDRQLREAQKRQSRMQDMQESRRLQAIAKSQAMIMTEASERASFERTYKAMMSKMENARSEEHVKEDFRLLHSKVLRQQITGREVARSSALKKFNAEGRTGAVTLSKKMKHLNSLKMAKIEQLKSIGVPQKYVSELSGYDPMKALSDDYKRGGWK